MSFLCNSFIKCLNSLTYVNRNESETRFAGGDETGRQSPSRSVSVDFHLKREKFVDDSNPTSGQS